MRVIGLTGGIGCGKSTVGDLFVELGAPVIDADHVAREVVAPGTPGLHAVVALFGAQILAPDGSLDRRALRALVFADPAGRQRLEGLLHPLIKRRIREHIATLTAPYCIVIVPLLIESGWQDLADRIVVVDCSPDVQLARAMARDGQTEHDVRAIMAAQADRVTRLAAADYIIDNNNGPDHLRGQVHSLHRKFLAGDPDGNAMAGL